MKTDEQTPAGQAGAQDTRFSDFDDADHPFRIWWGKHGQYMMSGGGRRESIWAARGWIAREQLLRGVKVTGESMREPAPSGEADKCPRCGSADKDYSPDGDSYAARYCEHPWHDAGDSRNGTPIPSKGESKESFLSRWPENEKGWTNRAMEAYNKALAGDYRTVTPRRPLDPPAPTTYVPFAGDSNAVPSAEAGETRQAHVDFAKAPTVEGVNFDPDDAAPSSVSEGAGQQMTSLSGTPIEICQTCHGTGRVAASQPASPVTAEQWVENLREMLHDTYNGGHHDEPAHSAFHHGMDTVCNQLGRGGSLERYAALRAQGQGQDDETANGFAYWHEQWFKVSRELDQVKRELAKCGKENCMGQDVEGLRRWVAKERLDAAESKLADRERLVGELVEGLRGIVNWCRHPNHGGTYHLPKPLEPYLMQAKSLIEKAGAK